MRVATVSFNPSWMATEANRARCSNIIESAASSGCDLVCFPESAFSGFAFEHDVAEVRESSSTLNDLSVSAVENGVGIIFGAFFKSGTESRVVHNSAIFINEHGDVVTEYQKIHLFSHGGENLTITAGKRPTIFSLGGHQAALAICYDLRFPAMFQGFSPDVDLVFVLANWPAQRVSHWRTLLAARAIETQAFVVGINRVGLDGRGQDHEESSGIYCPDGNCVKPELEVSNMGLKIFDIDLNVARAKKSTFPLAADRVTWLDYPAVKN